VKILGMTYSVKLMQARILESSKFGQHNGVELKITIARDMSVQQQVATMLHETLEAINYQLGLGLEEKAILGLERGLHGTLIDAGVNLNPLTKELRNGA